MRAVGHGERVDAGVRAPFPGRGRCRRSSARIRFGARKFLHQLVQHGRMRLRIGLVGAARRREQRLQVAGTRARGRARGGSCRWQPPDGVRLGQDLPASRACRRRAASCPRARGNAGGSARRTRDSARAGRPGHGDAQRVVQARGRSRSCARSRVGHLAGRVARPRRWMHSAIVAAESISVPSQSKTSSRYLTAGAVSRKALHLGGQRRLELHAARRSAGAGTQASPRAGQRLAAACSCRLSAKSPYLSSPSDRDARRARGARGSGACGRSSARTSSRLNSAQLFSSLTRVTAVLPSSCTLTRRSPAAVTYLCSDSRSSKCLLVASRPSPARGRSCRTSPSRSMRCSSTSALRFFASSSRPEVSRSSRCTSSRNLACGRAARSYSMTPKLTPLPPWTATPDGLSITSRAASSNDRPATRAAAASTASCSATRTGGIRTRSPTASR